MTSMMNEEQRSQLAIRVKKDLQERGRLVEDFLRICLDGKNIPENIREAMYYSLHAGGKRLRPVLCVTVAKMLGTPADSVLSFAGAFELIHTYSLVHDDLPAMDDDDLRRGKPSNHKVYGEAMAILAGDGLLTEAFGLMAESMIKLPGDRVVLAIAELSNAAGAAGMVGGQALDMEYTGKDSVTFDELRAMHALKTGALIESACVCGALLSGASKQVVAKLREFGACIGAAFQIADDILDEVGDEEQLGKPVGSDREQGKVTYPSLLGLEKSRELAYEFVEKGVAELEEFSGADSQFLRDLALYIVERTS